MSRRQNAGSAVTEGPAPFLDNDEQSKIVDELTKESDTFDLLLTFTAKA